MKNHLQYRMISLAAGSAFACVSLQAGPVTNWHTFKASPATTLSGQGTSNPVFGSAALPSTQGFLVGYFDPMSLTNVGDRITFSHQVTFTDAGGMGSAGDNFRYALFDLNGQTPVTAENTATAGVDGQTDNWRGYWLGNKGGGGAGNNGSMRERIAALLSGDNIFAATGANSPTVTNPGTPSGSEITLQSATGAEGGPLYTAVLAVEKTASGVALAGYLGGNGATNLFLANDNTTPWPVNYGAVGWLNGALNCDQFNLKNVTVTYTASNALHITSQPANQTVVVGNPARFDVAWTGSGIIPSLQWRENDVDIPDATNATYIIPSVTTGQDNYNYRVVISNVFGDSTTSSPALLTVSLDTVKPTVLSASSLISNTLNVVFSEPVDAVTSQDSQNYTLSGHTLSIVSVIGETNVQFTVDPPLTGNYTLQVQNVKDVPGNTMLSTNVPGIAHGFQDSVMIGISDGLAFAMNEKVIGYAGGDNIFNASDHFQFIYKPMSGDFDMAVQVEALLNTDLNARAGLMARPDTFFDSRNVLMEATPSRFIFQYRTNNAEATLAVGSPRPPTAYPNSWIRLVRSGSVFTGYSSTTASVWTLISSHDTATGSGGAYPNDILLGFAVSSGNVSAVTRAQFASDFSPSVVVVPPTLAVAPIGNNVEVSWDTNSIGFTLQAAPNVTAPITWTNVPNSSVTNRVFVPIANGPLYFRAIHF